MFFPSLKTDSEEIFNCYSLFPMLELFKIELSILLETLLPNFMFQCFIIKELFAKEVFSMLCS